MFLPVRRPSSTTAVITSCAFDTADLPHGEGVNYARETSVTHAVNSHCQPDRCQTD
jgi:hypothetical protein